MVKSFKSRLFEYNDSGKNTKPPVSVDTYVCYHNEPKNGKEQLYDIEINLPTKHKTRFVSVIIPMKMVLRRYSSIRLEDKKIDFI